MAVNKIRNRKTNEIKEIKEDKTTLFLYGNAIGRIFAKFLSLRFISIITGCLMNLSISKYIIPSFIKKNGINMENYLDRSYSSFNDFFIREINFKKRQFDKKENIFISPCDGKLTVYKIDEDSQFKIKNDYYQIKDLVNNDKISKEYIDGYALIFRLCVDDYHRYCYIDNGYQGDNHQIKGELHAVRPIVLETYNIYKRNSRVWTMLKTKNFGNIIQVEIGALNVGKIHNHKNNNEFKKGEEKGYFKFGGSTIVLLIKENQVIIDEDLINYTKDNVETIIKYGEKIGVKSINK